MPPRLTIVLPVKGRALFTLRFLWHANKARVPYRFLIADGQINETIANYLENSRDVFPELDIAYVRYLDDITFDRFFAKMFDALQRVRTSYAMLADNDDFLGIDGIEGALDFLDNNPDYVCARGRIVAFSVYSGSGYPDGSVRGKLNSLRTSYPSEDVSAPFVADRLRHGGLGIGTYYAVFRAEALTTIWREVAEFNFSDLMIHEIFHAMRALTLGKVCTNNAAISYFRQIGTSMTFQPSRDWVYHLLRSRLTSDADAAIKRIATVAAAADGAGYATIAEDVATIIERYFRDYLSMNFGLLTQIKTAIREKLPKLYYELQTRRRFSIGRDRSVLLSQLAACGASREYLIRTRVELEEIESALSHEAYASFAGPFLPMISADSNRSWY